MIKRFYFYALTLLTVLLSSCDQDINVSCPYLPYYTTPTYITPGTNTNNGNSPITFTAYSNGQPITRASVVSASGEGYDDFTLYVWTKDSVVMDKYHTQFVSPGWTYVGVDGQQLKYFDNFVDQYNFIGVMPQTTASISNGAVTTSVEGFTVDNEQTTDTPKEFLYEATTLGKEKYSEGVTMSFKHGNAKVYLKFTSNDSGTEIIDYYPSSGGYHEYEMQGKPFVAVGPLLTAVAISDEDIDYINSHYSVSTEWKGYYSSNVTINGDLNTDMLGYLKNKYDFTGIQLENWGNYINNDNMRLVHLEKTGKKVKDNDSYRGFFVNISNVTLVDKGMAGSSGVNDIVVLPATSSNGTGSDAVLSTYPQTADVTVSLNGLSWSTTSTGNSLTFTKPTTKVTSNDTNSAIASPTTWYTLPCNASNVGYTVKFSYVYKGTTVYDSRVFIPATECQWTEGKYYTYIIQINGRGNGHVEPNNPEANDPVIEGAPQNNEIKLFKVEFNAYQDGGVVIKEIK